MGAQPSQAINGRSLSVLMVDSHDAIERGGAVQCASLARALARRGHRVTSVFDGLPGTIPQRECFKRLIEAGVTIRFYRLTKFSSILKFRRELLSELPDIIHTHKNRALRFVYAASRRKQLPPWVANRGTIYPLSREPLAHRIHRRHVDRIVAVSEAVRDALERDRIRPHKVEVIYGSFDPDRFHPGVDGFRMRKRWDVPSTSPLVGMVASLRTAKKGHSVFLKAAARLLSGHPLA
ncbi:MAG: glycosyltransferase family 4 protein [Anaerolineae bacterium]